MKTIIQYVIIVLFFHFLIGSINAQKMDFVFPEEYPPNNKRKVGYVLEFEDDFENSDLDLTKWVPYYLPQWSSREMSQPKYKVENGNLVLMITEDQKPWCVEFNGNIKCSSLQTGLFAGSLGTKQGQHRFSANCVVREEQKNQKLYVPKYGYFEIRARVDISKQNVAAFWMIGYEDHLEHSGEICLMEIKGTDIMENGCINGIDIHPFGDPKLKDEFYKETYAIDPSKFHIYAVDWKPKSIDFYIDNLKVKTIHQSPDYPMQFMLNIYDLAFEGLTEEQKQYPNKFEIDYVRGYRYIEEK